MPNRANQRGKEGDVMPKLGEINYLKSAGAEGVEHVRNKPFSDAACGRYLGDLGLVMGLLPPPPARILDLGVGSGWTTAFLARRGYDVVGRDICPDMIALAEQNRDLLSVDSASFEVGDYESMSYRNDFDAVLFYDALHHAEDESAALTAAYASLRPGGICLTVEPGEGHAAVSTEAVKSFGVTEKDMPPYRIIEIGRSIGFRQFRVYSRSSNPVLLATAGPEGLPQLAEKLSRLQCAFGFAWKSLRALFLGAREGDSEFLSHSPVSHALRVGNIVLLQK
jgi:SAM-dependent methyltransferase